MAAIKSQDVRRRPKHGSPTSHVAWISHPHLCRCLAGNGAKHQSYKNSCCFACSKCMCKSAPLLNYKYAMFFMKLLHFSHQIWMLIYKCLSAKWFKQHKRFPGVAQYYEQCRRHFIFLFLLSCQTSRFGHKVWTGGHTWNLMHTGLKGMINIQNKK